MTELLYSPKIKPEHLARKAIVYLRQSTDKQVRHNQESQRLQHDLGERMHALGWSEVEIIGHDLGASAAIGAARREGFERVLSWVALGEVGIVVSREVSRLFAYGQGLVPPRGGVPDLWHAHRRRPAGV
jgi:hypothetical protein